MTVSCVMSRHDKTGHSVTVVALPQAQFHLGIPTAIRRLSCGNPADWTGWCDMVDWIFHFLNPSNHPHFNSRVGNWKTQFVQIWPTYAVSENINVNNITYEYVLRCSAIDTRQNYDVNDLNVIICN